MSHCTKNDLACETTHVKNVFIVATQTQMRWCNYLYFMERFCTLYVSTHLCMHVFCRVTTHEPKPTALAPSWHHLVPPQKAPKEHWPPNNRANHSRASHQLASCTTHLAAVGGSRESSVALAHPGEKDQTAASLRRTRRGERRLLGEVIIHYSTNQIFDYSHERIIERSKSD